MPLCQIAVVSSHSLPVSFTLSFTVPVGQPIRILLCQPVHLLVNLSRPLTMSISCRPINLPGSVPVTLSLSTSFLSLSSHSFCHPF